MRLAPIALLFSCGFWLAPGQGALTAQQKPAQHSTQLQSGHVLSSWTHEWQESIFNFVGQCLPASYDNSTGLCQSGYDYKAESRTDVQVGSVVYESDQVYKQVQVGGDYPVNIKRDKQGRAKALALVVGGKTYRYSIQRTKPDDGTKDELEPQVAYKWSSSNTMTEADFKIDHANEIQVQDVPTGPIQISDLHAYLNVNSDAFLNVSYKLNNRGQKKISAFTLRFSTSTGNLEYSVPETIEPGASVERKESLFRYDDFGRPGKHKFVVAAVGFADGTIWNRP